MGAYKSFYKLVRSVELAFQKDRFQLLTVPNKAFYILYGVLEVHWHLRL